MNKGLLIQKIKSVNYKKLINEVVLFVIQCELAYVVALHVLKHDNLMISTSCTTYVMLFLGAYIFTGFTINCVIYFLKVLTRLIRKQKSKKPQ